MNLNTPLSEISRVGPVYQKRLKKLGLEKVQDLFWYFPRAFEDLTVITQARDVKEGSSYCLKGFISNIEERRTFKKRFSLTEGLFSDSSGTLKIVWFNQPYIKDNLKDKEEVYAAGKIVRDKSGFYLSNPTLEKSKETLIHMGYTKEDPGLNTIGYKQLFMYLSGAVSLDEARTEWITKEYQYARRQFTLMKKNKSIVWYNCDEALLKNINNLI